MRNLQNQKPFQNANMEGQLCYDFPSPKNPLKNLWGKQNFLKGGDDF